MVGEFIQVFALLLAISVLLLLFYMLTVRRDRLTPPLAVFLVLLFPFQWRCPTSPRGCTSRYKSTAPP